MRYSKKCSKNTEYGIIDYIIFVELEDEHISVSNITIDNIEYSPIIYERKEYLQPKLSLEERLQDFEKLVEKWISDKIVYINELEENALKIKKLGYSRH